MTPPPLLDSGHGISMRARLFRTSGTVLVRNLPMNRKSVLILFSAWLFLPAFVNAVEPKSYPFFPFCIDWHDAKKRSYEQQAVMLKELGYDGVGHIWLDQVAERLKTLDDAWLKLFQITMIVEVGPGKKPYDARFKDVLALVKGRQVQFCLLVNGM